MNSNIVKFSFVLMLTAGLAIAGVALVYGISKPEIVAKKKRAQAEAVALAFNKTQAEFAALKTEALTPENDAWKVSDAGGGTLGYAAKGSAGGYGGDVEVIAAFRPDLRTLIGAAIMDVSRETPGLGQNASQKKPTTTWLQDIFGVQEVRQTEGGPLDDYTFMQQFQDKNAAKLKVVTSQSPDGIVAMSGATISSKAVLEAVKNALKKLQERSGASSADASSGGTECAE